ncbi:MAG: bifunctional adenosylcobinamide kinase/adenosylcobinamide-phosphate guanylyltransferase [Frankiales bacterium]|nr:bifunctional adenosylcobinamide kinase/adenosylcobinamide-phosphate guanylyltransferase [Frankiales bacterium]
MQVRILGSGAASGWPNPWCSCDSCAAARSQGVLRGQTSVLVDGRLLIDLGPDGLRAAARFGTSLEQVEGVLVTHCHDDHHHPMAWQWRTWAKGTNPVTLLAPPLVLAEAGTDGQVTTLEALPGTRHDVAGYDVRVLEAEHQDDAVLYDITAPDGARLLYATDTGALPESTLSAVQDRGFDVVLLECAGTPIPSHLTLDTWPEQVRRLRAAGAVTDQTALLAIHVGHDNPAPDELDRRLAEHGARAVRDGEVLDTHRGRRVLVIGGQSSGKSAYAEGLLHGDVTYVATAGDRRGDADWSERVARHRARRPPSWHTVETHDLATILGTATGPVLIDDLGLWLTNVLEGSWESPGARSVFDLALSDLLEAWRTTRAEVVLVAPEVGSGVVASTASGRLFSDLLGRATTALAHESDEVVQVVAGQPRRLR